MTFLVLIIFFIAVMVVPLIFYARQSPEILKRDEKRLPTIFAVLLGLSFITSFILERKPVTQNDILLTAVFLVFSGIMQKFFSQKYSESQKKTVKLGIYFLIFFFAIEIILYILGK